MLFINPDSRNTFAPHCDEAFTVRRARHHYHLLEFYVPTTRRYRISGTFRLNPTHWKLPIISEQDKTVVEATELLEQHKKFTPLSAIHKIKQIAIIKKLQEILSNNPRQRVEKAREPRVDNTPPQRVNTATLQRVNTGMTSNGSPKYPRVLRTTPHIHQRHTRQNTPMPAIMEVAEPHTETKTATKQINQQPVNENEHHSVPAAHRYAPPPTPLPICTYHLPSRKGKPAPAPITQDKEEPKQVPKLATNLRRPPRITSYVSPRTAGIEM